MQEKIQKMASLQSEALELLKQNKVEEVIEKMQDLAIETEKLNEEVSKKTEENNENNENNENEVKKFSSNEVEVEVKKYADMYLSGENLSTLITQILEASELFSKVKSLETEVKTLKTEEKPKTSLDPAEVKKSEDKYSVWEGL